MAEEKEKVENTKKQNNKDSVTKVKVKKMAPKDNITKVDLSKPQIKDEEIEKQSVDEDVVVVNPEPEEVKEEVVEEQPVLQEITEEEETLIDEVEQAVTEAETTGKPLPEKVEKLINFMEETGGDLTDYVNLNRDVKNMDDSDVLDEYYRATKSHLTAEERGFLLEDTFGVNEEIDDEKTIRKKKIALKEQVAEAKAYLDGQKSKYYEDIKAGSKLTQEQQKACLLYTSPSPRDS